MPTTLTNGIQLPDKGSVDWYNSMQSNYNLIDTHLGNTDTHVTAEDKANWNSKQGSLSQAQLDAIAQVATNTSDIATLQSGKANASHTHSSSDITDIGDYATKQYVDNSISGLVDSAPNALDTLKELSTALNDDANFASTVATALSAKANSADLATVATSGSYNDLSNKPSIPTKTSDLTNDSNFVDTSNSAVASGITSAKVTSYDAHIADTDIHVTTADKSKWNNGVSQSYVLRYSSASVTDNSTIAYSTLDNTDNIKSSDKVIDVNGKIFSIVSVDTANQTVTVGTAIVDLALDANVVHTSGDENVSGVKCFTNDIIRGSVNTNSTIQVRNLIGKTTASTTGSNSSSYQSITATLNYSDSTPSKSVSVNLYVNENAYADGKYNAFYPSSNNVVNLGISGKRWANVYATNYYYGSSEVEFSTKFVTSDTAQTISGAKTFSSNINVYNSDSTGNTPSIYLRNSKVTKGGSDTGNQSIFFTDKDNNTLSRIFTNNPSNGSTSINFNVSTLDSYNADVSTEVSLFVSKNGTKVLQPIVDNDVFLGRTSNKWKDVNTYLVNGLEPSSLSMPDLSNGIDISSYITVVANANKESLYTPPANGWVCVRLSRTSGALGVLLIQGGMASSGKNIEVESGATTADAMLPVVGGVQVSINSALADGVVSAYFYPCQGNV